MTFHEPLGNVQVSLLICISVFLLPLPLSLSVSLKLETYPAYGSICIVFLLLQLVSNLHCCGGAQSHASLFSFLLTEAGVSLLSLPLFLCVILANQYRDRSTMIAFSPTPPRPPLQFSPLSVSEQSREERSIAQQPC